VNQLGGLTARKALMGLAAIIVVGGILVALSSSSFGLFGTFTAAPSAGIYLPSTDVLGNNYSKFAVNENAALSDVIGGATTTTTVFGSTTTGAVPNQPGTNVTQGSPTGSGGLIEFSTDIGISTSSPEQTASDISALAYSVGGYVAYQSTYSTSAYVVIRVPAALYQQVLKQVKAMGAFVSETSNSNDVRVQYTDLNATFASLQTEDGALLRLLNESTTINSTLAIEAQLQQVNQQINEVETQILQTRTLIDYATINVTVTETSETGPLSLALSAIPRNGTAPLSVTFNAIVKGGSQPYVVNYNFGDGYATEGQIVIHTYNQAGNYEVVVSVTDQNGTVVQRSTTVNVQAVPAQSGVASFFGNVGNLFLSVVEGIVEVAVVVLPIAAVGAAIIIPVQRRGKAQKGLRQAQ
jgi:PKD repeat protein